MIDGIIFDVDGTLWDSTHVVADAWNSVLESEKLNIHVTSDELKKEFGKPLEEIGNDLLPGISPEDRARITSRWISAEAESVAKNPPKPYDGIEDSLKIILKKHPLFLVSNSKRDYLDTFFRVTGLGKYFRATLCNGDTGKSKAETIRILADEYFLRKPVYVGDTQLDCDSAREAGIRFAHAAYGFGEVKDPDFRVYSARDLGVLFG